MINTEKFILAVVFTAVVTVHTGFWGEINTSALAANYSKFNNQIFSLSKVPLLTDQANQANQANQGTPALALPPRVLSAIQTDLQQRASLTPENFTITSFIPRTWADACLGLARADQMCAQIMTPGWRVIISSREAETTWVYRTNQNGTVLRLE